MKRGMKKKWLEALRSGKYEQGEGYLRRGLSENDHGCYCCLGVLYEVTGGAWKFDENLKAFRTNRNATGMLWDSWESYHLPGDVQILLSRMNDGYIDKYGDHIETSHAYRISWSFSEIADWIEANVR